MSWRQNNKGGYEDANLRAWQPTRELSITLIGPQQGQTAPESWSHEVDMALGGHMTPAIFDRYKITNERDLSDAAPQLEAYIPNGHNSGTLQVSDAIPAKIELSLTHLN